MTTRVKHFVMIALLSMGLFIGVLSWQTVVDDHGGATTMESDNILQVRGKVFHASDVMTIPDRPYSSGLVFAVPADKWSELSDRVGMSILARRLRFSLSTGDLTDVGAQLADVDHDGGYALELKTGRYAICVGNLGGPPPNSQSIAIIAQGCFEMTLAGSDTRLVDIFFGEGGVQSNETKIE